MTRALVIVIAALASLAAVYALGHRAGAAGVYAEWQEYRRLIDAAASLQGGAHRKREQQLTDQLIEAQNALDSAIRQGNADRDSAIADLHADNLRLRERFRGCGSGGVPEDPAADSGDDGASARGLSEQDAEFLIRIAAEADALAHRLAACQSYARSTAAGQ